MDVASIPWRRSARSSTCPESACVSSKSGRCANCAVLALFSISQHNGCPGQVERSTWPGEEKTYANNPVLNENTAILHYHALSGNQADRGTGAEGGKAIIRPAQKTTHCGLSEPGSSL